MEVRRTKEETKVPKPVGSHEGIMGMGHQDKDSESPGHSLH